MRNWSAAPHYRAHCEIGRQLDLRVSAVKEDQRRHHRGVPEDGRCVGHEEAAVAVKNSQAPRGEDEQSGAWKKNSGELDRQVALLRWKAIRDYRDEPGSRHHPNQNDDRCNERQDAGYCPGELRGLLLIPASQQPSVFWNERGREHAFAQQVLEQIGDSESGIERVCGEIGAHVPGDHGLANEPGKTAEKDS